MTMLYFICVKLMELYVNINQLKPVTAHYLSEIDDGH